MSIIGHNKSYITLYSSMSLTIAHDAISNDTNWAWIGLAFISGTDHTDLKIRHRSFNSLTILNCSIMTAEWDFEEIRNLVISNSKFGQTRTCPTLYVGFEFQVVNFTFSNNSVSDCSANDIILLLFSVKSSREFAYLAIVNCTFTGINRSREVATSANPNTALQRDFNLISVDTISPIIVSINSSYFIDNKELILACLYYYGSLSQKCKIKDI